VTTQTAPSDTVTRDDIEAKLREIRGEAASTGESARNYAVVAGVVVAVAMVGAAYLWGKRRGKKRTTVVEIRRV
jgi:LPXTG-motif cell wall-anchored protein